MKTNYYASNPRGSSAPNLSIEELIDAQPLSVRQLAIVALCFAVAALDGLDLAIVGFVAPAIRAEWQLHPNDLALLFSAGLLGLTVGAFVAGPIADTLSRKKVGIGRLGAVLGSIAGAWLFSRGLGLQAAFALTALPALAISATIAILGRIHSVTDSPQLQPSKIQQLTNPIPAAPRMGQETYSVH